MKLALLLLLVGTAWARCPEGLEPIENDARTIEDALFVGGESWGESAKEQWCDELPQYITNPAGLEYYNTTITPTCVSPDGTTYHFTVESNNPCDEMKPYVGYMDVVTNSSTCDLDWVRMEQFTPVVNATNDLESVAPLQCAEGYRAADEEEIEGKATKLIWEILVEPRFQELTAGQIPDSYYCAPDESVGYKYINITSVSACMSEDTEETSMVVQAQALWVCAQQARRRTVSLTVSTPYTMACDWVIDLEMGDSPEVFEPSA